MTLIVWYLEHDTCKSEEDKAMKQQCSGYTMLNQDLYQRGYSTSLLKCITKDQVEYVLKEIHEGVCDNHSSARTMVAKVLRVGYYWLTSKGIAQSLWRNVPSAKSWVPCTTWSQKYCIAWHPHGRSPSGGWTSSLLSLRESVRQNSSLLESTISPNGPTLSHSHPFLPRTCKTLYDKVRHATHNNNWQWSTVHRSKAPIFLCWPWYQVHNSFGRAPLVGRPKLPTRSSWMNWRSGSAKQKVDGPKNCWKSYGHIFAPQTIT